MSELNISDAATSGHEDQSLGRNPQNKSDRDFVKPSLRRFARVFRQLAWSDRLNMVLAGVLEMALIALLSPILLVSRAVLLTKPKRRTNVALKSHQT